MKLLAIQSMKCCAITVAVCLTFPIERATALSQSPNASVDSTQNPDLAERRAEAPTLTVLDPVDVNTGRTAPRYGDILRRQLESAAKFRPLSREEMEKKLADFNWDPAKPCHEFQCGFDAGNVLLTEYVCFGTVTSLQGLFAYTFNILHVPTGQVIVSEVGEVPSNPGSDGEEPLKARMSAFVSGLDAGRLDKAKRASRGLMAVVDLSVSSPESRVLAERVGTHAYASRHYDLMSQLELQELLTAMNIPLANIASTDSGLIALGARLNVAFLVQSRLSRESRGQKLDLALFDIPGKRRIRDWPSKPTREFQDLLHFENRFFTTLLGLPDAQGASPDARAEKPGRRPSWKKGLLSVLGLSAAAGFGFLAYSFHQEADKNHGLAETSLSGQANHFKRATEAQDKSALLNAALSAISLGASITLFSF